MRTGRPTNTHRSDFGRRLHQARLAAGFSQSQMAGSLGISQPAYAAWERENVALRPEQLATLCEILKVKIEQLFEDSPPARSNGPVGKARRIFEKVSQLPHRQQQRILATVEDMVFAQEAKAS